MDALVRLGLTVTTLLAQAAGVAAAVVISWKFLMVILSGGSERALGQLIRMLLVMGIAIAVLANPGETVELVTMLGGALFRTVMNAARGAEIPV
jgi:hypothetical protein